MELVQVLLRQRGLYHGRGGRLMIFLRHNMMIIGRSPSLHPPTSQDHEVRLPYWQRPFSSTIEVLHSQFRW